MKRLVIRPLWLLLALLVVAISVVTYNAVYQKGLQQAAERVSRTDVTDAASGLIGQRRPDFSLPDTDGLPRTADEWNGKVLVVNFWADNCLPCRREIPAFIHIQRDLAERGVQFVGIAINERDAVRTFASEMGIEFNYPILTGESDAIEVARSYGNEIGILPYTVVIDSAGIVAQAQFGEVQADELQAMLAPLI